VALLVALLTPVLLMFCAFAVDVARWYVEAERVQKVADAASNAGVIYMPQDFAQAQTTAKQVAARNGYPDGGNVQITVAPGPRASQLQVTVSSSVSNAFAAIFGISRTTVTRTAVSDYAGPVPMGSPCNLFGNEPLAVGELSTGSATNCTFGSTPNFWANIAGPQTSKQNGDEFATQGCSSGSDSFCQGAGQADNCDHFGSSSCQGVSVAAKPVYYYRLRLAAGAGTVDLQVYDPAFINVGDHCTVNLPFTSSSNAQWPGSNTPNPFVTDAKARYEFGDPTTTNPTGSGKWCTGDNQFGFSTSLPVTTYALLAPTDTGDPAKSAPIAGCTPRQYRGLNVDLSKYLNSATTEGRSTDGTYAQRNFRQWVSLQCPLSAPASGLTDYYLEVRTNLKAGTVTNSRMADPSDEAGVTGSGHNRFAMRAVAIGNKDAVSLAAYERMPIYANFRSGTTTKFYLARVPTSGAGHVLKVVFFDTGDSVDTGIIAIAAPPDNRGTTAPTCVDKGFIPNGSSASTNLPGCQLTNVNSSTGYQGKAKEIDVQVPADYLCTDTSNSGCWFTVSYSYGTTTSGGAVADTTTWTASLDGDPVRLVK
jgi:hypothetical protein